MGNPRTGDSDNHLTVAHEGNADIQPALATPAPRWERRRDPIPPPEQLDLLRLLAAYWQTGAPSGELVVAGAVGVIAPM